MSFITYPLQDILIKPKRSIGGIEINVIISENANDSLEITQQPVQQGAMISDHAFKKPVTLSMQVSFRDNALSPLNDTYDELLTLQASRVPFQVVTKKRTYQNMLIASLTQTTDKNTENCLAISFLLQEVIIVNVSVVEAKQSNPAKTGKTQKAGKKVPESAISRVFG